MKTLVSGIRTIARGIGIDVVRYRDSAQILPHDVDAGAALIWHAVRDYTMTSALRVLTLLDAVRYIVQSDIRGDIVECGVWRGGSMMAAAMQLTSLGKTDRDLYLFDTFEGMPPPTQHDIDPHGTAAHEIFGPNGRSAGSQGLPWKAASVEEVRAGLMKSGYPQDRFKLIKGRTENTVPAAAPGSIALLRLDTDWYESTRHEMLHLFPRIASGGVLLIDDYGYWKGSRKAVDEYIKEHKLQILLCRVDDSARIAIVR